VGVRVEKAPKLTEGKKAIIRCQDKSECSVNLA
jgi:hypothetical protein